MWRGVRPAGDRLVAATIVYSEPASFRGPIPSIPHPPTEGACYTVALGGHATTEGYSIYTIKSSAFFLGRKTFLAGTRGSP